MATLTLHALPSTHTALRDWVRARLGSIRHELRVAALADRLFLLTRRLHRLPPRDRRLLHLAALVHDVGRAVCDKGHAKIGARMLRHDNSLPLNLADRDLLAFLTRHHRGKVPALGLEKHLSPSLSRTDRHRARLLLAFLRAADSFDARSLPTPRIHMSCRDRTLTLTFFIPPRLPVEDFQSTYASPKKRALLESLLSLQTRIICFVAAT